MPLKTLTDLTAVIDGGTTRTRLRLWDGAHIAWEGSRQVGARDVAQHGRKILESALADMVAEARGQHAFDRMVAFGMITSNMGLHEIPHLEAPASYAALAGAIAAKSIPAIGVMHFIPGIKTVGPATGLAGLASFDIMRGEETEVAGMREFLALRGPVNFFHVGSHHKLVRTDDAAILGSVTALSGEILAALLENTILASSAAPLASVTEVDQDWWNAGLQTAGAHGFARAAFCVRLADQVLHATREQATAFLLGAVASLDVPILSGDLPLYLYGHLTVTRPLSIHLAAQGIDAHVVEPETSKPAAMHGAVHLLAARLAGAAGGA